MSLPRNIMEILSRISFIGTKFYHRRYVRIELSKDQENWIAAIYFDGVSFCNKIVYKGDVKSEAERQFIDGFTFYFTDGYKLDVSDPMTKEGAMMTLHRAVEYMLTKMAVDLGYAFPDGLQMKTFFRTIDRNTVDGIGVLLEKAKEKVTK